VHFGNTSEDVNSAAYALMLSRARALDLGKLASVREALLERAELWADLPMLAMIHG
jgi:adenylosuccinate lyase